jgi:large subunit ribosomal protein L24e
MTQCSFCKKQYEIPRGMTIVQKDGSLRYYCSSKCRKNSNMGRDSKKLTWITKSKESQAAIARERSLSR